MTRWLSRAIFFGGALSAILLVPVGMMMTVFGFGQAVLNWFEFAESETNLWIAIAVLALTFAMNGVPLLLFWLVWSYGNARRVCLGLALLLLSPIFGWVGFDSLILRGDWGDFVLWGPYLLTGLCMAIIGTLIIAGRWKT